MAGSSPQEEEFNRLWRDHAGAVLRYARRRVSEEQADEVVAETFVVAWRRLEEIPAAALPWLLGVARRVSANLRRSDRRREALHDRLVDGQRPHDLVTVPADGLLRALDQLPEEDRELLMLLAWDGLSRAEAATVLRCSRGALAVRLHRARKRLRAAMNHTVEQPLIAAPGGAR